MMTAIPGGLVSARWQLNKGLGGNSQELLADECRKVRIAQWLIGAGHLRGEQFGATLFGDPAWEMLLQLYVRETTGLPSTPTDLRAHDEPVSRAQRWLIALQQQGLILRKHLATGSDLVVLTAKGEAALETYLSAVRRL